MFQEAQQLLISFYHSSGYAFPNIQGTLQSWKKIFLLKDVYAILHGRTMIALLQCHLT